MEMIERVARAIFEAMDVADGLDGSSAERYALAAIEAMREPTDDMARAGFSSDAFRTPMLRLEADFEPKAVWQAMIDAALKP